MKRLLTTAALAFASVLAGCSTSSSDGESKKEQTYTREEVRSWSKDHVVVLVSRRNGVRFNNAPTSPADLPARLEEAGKATPGRPVIVMLQAGADPKAADFIRTHAAKAGLGAVEVR